MNTEQTESALIGLCLESDNIHILRKRGLDSSHLAVWGEVLEFIYSFEHKYSHIPTLETTSLAYPDFPISDTNNYDVEYLVDIVLENFRKRKLHEIIDDTIDKIDEGVGGAIEHFRSKSLELNKKELSESYLDHDPEGKISDYIERNKFFSSGELVGIKTGLSVLDREFFGWLPGDLVMLIGPPEVGKSWVLLRMCVSAYTSGKKILYISPEMSSNDVLLRFHTILGREYGYSFSNEALTIGNGIDLDIYRDFLNRIGDRKDWRIVDSEDVLTVNRIEGLVSEFKPDIVAIDPLPLLTSADGSLAISWTAILEVAYSLKFLATRLGIVVIVSSISTGDTFGRKAPAESYELGLGRYILYAADIAISMSLTIDAQVRHMKIIKKRKGKSVDEIFPLTFDPDIGRIQA